MKRNTSFSNLEMTAAIQQKRKTPFCSNETKAFNLTDTHHVVLSTTCSSVQPP